MNYNTIKLQYNLNHHQIKHNMVSGITPDGAVDGQCGLHLIGTLI